MSSWSWDTVIAEPWSLPTTHLCPPQGIPVLYSRHILGHVRRSGRRGHACTPCLSVSASLRLYELRPTRLLCPWDFPGKNTGVGCNFWAQGIFPAQGFNPPLLPLLHWHVDLSPLSHLGSQQLVGAGGHSHMYFLQHPWWR